MVIYIYTLYVICKQVYIHTYTYHIIHIISYHIIDHRSPPGPIPLQVPGLCANGTLPEVSDLVRQALTLVPGDAMEASACNVLANVPWRGWRIW